MGRGYHVDLERSAHAGRGELRFVKPRAVADAPIRSREYTIKNFDVRS